MSSARVIDGRAIADDLCRQLRQHVGRLHAERGVTPGLAVVMVGDNPASAVYVRTKARQSDALGMRSAVHRLPVETTEAALLATIAALNADPAVHGILVQLPLPAAIDPTTVLAAIDPAKDVDGFHLLNAGHLATGTPGGLVPCTPSGCLKLIHSVRRDLAGLKAVIVGRSNIVGKPMALLLLQENCTVTIAHSRTHDLAAECRGGDILVAAVGRAEMIRGDWVKPGAIVIDVGINRVPADGGKSRLVGDVQFSGAATVAAAITPVPGGVGPMTVACLMLNTVIAACRRHGLPEPAL